MLSQDLFDGASTVVTVNQRLAEYLRNQHPSSSPKDILPLEAWIERCWQSLADPRIILNDFQENTQIKSTKRRIGFISQREEIYAMARWAQQCLPQRSNQTIGCVVPNLPALRDTIEHVFTEVFYFDHDPIFNFSVGKNLD